MKKLVLSFTQECLLSRLCNAGVARCAQWCVYATFQSARLLCKSKRYYNFHLHHFNVYDSACRNILLSQYEKLSHLFVCLKHHLVFPYMQFVENSQTFNYRKISSKLRLSVKLACCTDQSTKTTN